MAIDTVGVKYVADKAMLDAFYQTLFKDNSNLEKAVDGVNKKYDNLGAGATQDLKQIDAQTKKLKTDTDEQTKAVGKQVSAYRAVGREAKQTGGALSKLGPMIAAAFAFDKVIQLGQKIVGVTAEFQKFEAVLTNTLGSSSAAQGALNMIVDFAAKTPFSVQELTGSFVKLANQGFIPTGEEMRKLGDLAASQGKGFDMLTEAIIDAQTGEFERLKEFGIRASKEGDNVMFNFKGVETQTKFTADAMREYILTLGDLEGVSGGMAAISDTLGGKLSNAGDAIDQLFLKIGNGSSGALTEIIDVFTEVVSHVDQLGPYLTSLTDVWMSLFDSIEAVLGAFFDFNADGVTVEDVIKGIGTAMGIAQIPVKLMVSTVILVVDALRLLINTGKEVLNFFGADFELDPTISLDTLKKDIVEMKDIVTLEDMNKKAKVAAYEAAAEAIQAEAALTRTREQKRKEAEERIAEANAKETEKQKKAREKAAADALKAEQDYQKLLIENMKEGTGKELAQLEFKYQQEREKLKGNNKALIELQKAHEAEMIAVKNKGEYSEIEAELKIMEESNERKLAAEEAYLEDTEDLGEMFARFDQQATATEEDRKKKDDEKTTEEKLQDEKDLAEARQQIINTVTDAAFQIADTRRQARLDKELSALDAQRELELSNVELTEEGKAAIELKFAQQEAELKKKKAIQDKASAIIQATIAGALAVTKLLATPPLAIAAGVAAAAQIAIIAAQPIPQFREGQIDIQGPGTGTSDSIMARISKGESVTTAKRTKQYKAELQAIRDGQLDQYINTNYVLPVLQKAVERRDLASNMAASYNVKQLFDDSGIVSAIKGTKPATREDIKELGNTLGKAMGQAAYINSKMWKA